MGRTGTGKSSQGVKARLQAPGGHHQPAAMDVPGGGFDAGDRGAAGNQAGHFPVQDVRAVEFRAARQGQVEAVAVQLGGLVLVHRSDDGRR